MKESSPEYLSSEIKLLNLAHTILLRSRPAGSTLYLHTVFKKYPIHEINYIANRCIFRRTGIITGITFIWSRFFF